jgi:K+-transporting ATPase ATPase C chain
VRDVFIALRMTLALVLIGGVAFPAVLYGLAHLAFPWQSETSLVRDGCGAVVGSALVGQQFTEPGWFHSRPSAVSYNATGSGGSNLGPTNAALADSLTARADRFRVENGLAAGAALPPKGCRRRS